MVETSMNIFDLGVLTIVGLSALLSFFRGFMREVLSLGAWLGASVITLYTFPTVSKWIAPQVKSDVVASGLASMGTFFAALILISIFTSFVLKFTKSGSEVGVLDNVVGLCFGAARGILIVAIAYFVMTIVIVEKDYPDWVKHAKSRPYVAKVATWVGKLTPSYLNAITDKAKRTTATSSDDASDSKPHQPHTLHLPRIGSPEDEGNAPSTMPSIEDLQERIREENEKH